MKNEQKTDFDSTHIFMFIIRWWKHLAIICLAAAIAAAIFSAPFFITPKYQSTVTMFPSQSVSLSRSVLGVAAGTRDFLQYGEIDDAERLLQVLGSSEIRSRIIERFNLIEHYEIPWDHQYLYTRVNREYLSNVSFRRTEFGAVEVNVRDKDPAMAAKIANEIAALVDTVQNEMRYERALLAYEAAKNQYDNTQQEIKKSEDSLRVIMKKGVYDYEGQTAMLFRQLAQDISAGNTRGVRALEQRLEDMGEHGGSFMHLTNYIKESSENLATAHRRYQEAKADLESFVSFKFIIDEAHESERKVYPVRWLIVVISTFAAGFLGVVILMIYNNLENKGIIKSKNKSKSEKK